MTMRIRTFLSEDTKSAALNTKAHAAEHCAIDPESLHALNSAVGRQVLAMESQLVFDPDTLFLIFVLGDGRAPEPAAAAGEIAEANGL